MSNIPKIVVVHPGGGCGNYILMNLCKIDIKFTLAYHDHGTHSKFDNTGVYDIRSIKNKNNVKGILIITNRYYLDIDKIKEYNKNTIQICIDEFNELVVLNWFLKHESAMINSWQEEQKKHWKGKYNLEKAVHEWTIKMFDKNFEDIKRIPEIKKTFNFSCLYKNYDKARNEFLKFDIEYKEDTHKNFLLSQKPVLARWQNILVCAEKNPLLLEEYFTRGIALALHQKKLNLSKEEVYDKFNLNP
jgi:hypothetical protein